MSFPAAIGKKTKDADCYIRRRTTTRESNSMASSSSEPYSDHLLNPTEETQSNTTTRQTKKRRKPPTRSLNLNKIINRWIMKSYPVHISSNLHGLNHLLGSNLHTSSTRNSPIHLRPFFCALTAITLVFLAVIGFSKSIHSVIPIPKKLFHFFGFGIITGLIYWIAEIDDLYKVIWYWNYFNDILVGIICFFLGGFGSEFIQLFLPWKVFSWGDLLANELGCLSGYQITRILHRRYVDKLELSNLYEPLESGLRSRGGIEINSDEDEQQQQPDQIGQQQKILHSDSSVFSTNNVELSNVWSDRLDDHYQLFSFDDEEED